MEATMRPKILDLFCGAGGASMGYHLAGFEVVGVAIALQPNYPFEFHQADAMAFPLSGFDAIHASPPCQAYTRMARGLLQSQGRAKEHPRLIEPIRARLLESGLPYIIENVEGAPLIRPIRLCGSSFGLDVQRHRLFELSFFMLMPECIHTRWKKDKPPLGRLGGRKSRVVGCYGNGRGKGDTVSLWRAAMGISWMTRKELSQAIPPAYTQYIGRWLMEYLVTAKRRHHGTGYWNGQAAHSAARQ